MGEKTFTPRKIHHIPVIDGSDLVGIVSRTDTLNYSHSKAFVDESNQVDESLDHAVPVGELMTKSPLTLKASDTVKHAVEILNDQSFNSIPVIDSQGKKLVGIVTTKDLLSFLIQQY